MSPSRKQMPRFAFMLFAALVSLLFGCGRETGSLKDFRRVAARYDRRAVNFLAAVHIAAIVSYWL